MTLTRSIGARTRTVGACIAGFAIAGIFLVTPQAWAQKTVYLDNFNGTSGDLNGTTPTVTTGGATWLSAAGQYTETPSGTTAPGTVAVAGNGPTGVGPGAYLPFTIASANTAFPTGAIIDLSVTISSTTELNPANATTKTDWLAFGFTQFNAVGSDPSQSAVNGGPWLIYRVNGGVQIFQGGQTNNSFTPSATFTGPTQFDIVLNTSTNTETFFAGGTSTTPLYSTTATADPFSSFNYVTLAAHRASGNFSSFSLTETGITPEPGAMGMALSGLPFLGAFFFHRRRR